MKKDLMETFNEAAEKANKKDLIRFIFEFDGKYFISEFSKGVWQWPQLICLV